MYKYFLIWFFSGVLLPLMASESVLELPDFIHHVSKNDSGFHLLLMDQHRLNYDYDRFVASPDFYMSVVGGLLLDSSNIQQDSSINLAYVLPNLGQEYSTNFAFDGNNNNASSFRFSISQDIARNAFGKKNVLDGLVQNVKTTLSKYQIIEAYEDYMAELITLYYSWIRDYVSFQLAQSSYKENEKVLGSILKRQKNKIADTTDVNKFKLQLLAKEEQLIVFKKKYIETTRKIMDVIGIDSDEKMIPNSDIIIDLLPKNSDSEITALKDNRSFKILELLNQQGGLEQDLAARDILPSIILSTSLVKSSDYSGEIKASIDMPFFNKKEKANFEIARINQKQVLLETESMSDDLKMSIYLLYSSLQTQKQLVDLAREKRELAEAILHDESENYTFGKINLNDYIQAVNRYDSTRFDEIDQKITYQQLSIEWKRLTDTLVHDDEASL